jgi:hypothetical protein
MKVFISYSHHDEHYLTLLHKHLDALRRDGSISTWTDKDIHAGGKLDDAIHSSLQSSNLFIALVSADYISSNYCFDKEFKYAIELQERGSLAIVPVIAEPCDWQNTPLGMFKALPRDGKAISTWENVNTAFVDVVQNLRKLLTNTPELPSASNRKDIIDRETPRNYRIKRDFDSLQKLEFAEKTFGEVKEYLKRYLDEIIQLDNIVARIISNTDAIIEILAVNRNKIATEARIKIVASMERNRFGHTSNPEHQIVYTVNESPRNNDRMFVLEFDEYEMFWVNSYNGIYLNSPGKTKFTSKMIADAIWENCLDAIGIT